MFISFITNFTNSQLKDVSQDHKETKQDCEGHLEVSHLQIKVHNQSYLGSSEMKNLDDVCPGDFPDGEGSHNQHLDLEKFSLFVLFFSLPTILSVMSGMTK